MQVQKTTIESLFTHERRYLIPDRERERAKDESQAEDVARPHFMGAIVLQPRLTCGD